MSDIKHYASVRNPVAIFTKVDKYCIAPNVRVKDNMHIM